MWVKNKRILFLLAPSITFMVLFFLGGIKSGLWESLGLFSLTDNPGFTLDNYKLILNSPDFWSSWRFSMRIALWSTVISTVLALSIAMILFISTDVKGPHIGRAIYKISQVPMALPYIVAGGIMYLLFMKSGWISRVFFSCGFIESMSDFPVLINDKAGIGIIMAYVWKTTPFILLMIYPSILEMDRETIESAQICGASRSSIFWEVLFPSMKSALKTASFIVFAYSFGAFELPFMLGVTWPKALSVYSWQIYNGSSLEKRPIALAINMAIVVTIAILGICFLTVPTILKKALRRK